MIKNCLICDIKIIVDKWKINNGRGKYCSIKCSTIGKTNTPRPDMIGNTFGVGNTPWNKGISWSQEMRKKLSIAHLGQISWNKGKKLGSQSYETRMKQSLAQRGERGSNWRGGITTDNHLKRNNIEAKEWRKEVFERDDYTCQECNIKGIYLHAHHIKQFAYYPELRFDVNNGMTLCRECHRNTKHEFRSDSAYRVSVI